MVTLRLRKRIFCIFGPRILMKREPKTTKLNPRTLLPRRKSTFMETKTEQFFNIEAPRSLVTTQIDNTDNFNPYSLDCTRGGRSNWPRHPSPKVKFSEIQPKFSCGKMRKGRSEKQQFRTFSNRVCCLEKSRQSPKIQPMQEVEVQCSRSEKQEPADSFRLRVTF